MSWLHTSLTWLGHTFYWPPHGATRHKYQCLYLHGNTEIGLSLWWWALVVMVSSKKRQLILAQTSANENRLYKRPDCSLASFQHRSESFSISFNFLHHFHSVIMGNEHRFLIGCVYLATCRSGRSGNSIKTQKCCQDSKSAAKIKIKCCIHVVIWCGNY